MKPYLRTDYSFQLPTRLESIDFTKAVGKKPTVTFDSQGIGNFASGIGQLATMFNNQSQATTNNQVVQQSVQDVFSGIGAGATAGAAFHPIGAGIGAGVGALTGLIGRKGGVDEAGFYDDPNLRLNTGLRGMFGGNRSLRRKHKELKGLAQGNRFALSNRTDINQRWAEEYDDNVQTFVDGGIVNKQAYVDDGETISTPNGDILSVPEQGNPTDSNLVNLPVGSKILSDTLKYPGTNKSFAEISKELMSKKKKNVSNDKYARNTAMLNERNDKYIHDTLFDIQESMKQSNSKNNKFVYGGTNLPGYSDYYKWDPFAFQNTQFKNKLNAASRNTKSKIKALYDIPVTTKTIPEKPKKTLYDKTTKTIGDIGYAIGSVAPVISNLQAKPEGFDTVYNPYANTVQRTMGSRRYNIEPVMRSIKEGASIANYNAAQVSPNTGANMAFRVQNALNADKALTDLYAQKQNIDNTYKGEYANMLNSLGQQYVQAHNLATDLNARSRANARNIQREGMSQLSDYLQMNRRMRNQKANDMAMLDLYGPFLQSGYTSDVYNTFINRFKK